MDKAEIKFNLILPEKLHDKLRRVAFKQNRPMAEIVREAITEYLTK